MNRMTRKQKKLTEQRSFVKGKLDCAGLEDKEESIIEPKVEVARSRGLHNRES